MLNAMLTGLLANCASLAGLAGRLATRPRPGYPRPRMRPGPDERPRFEPEISALAAGLLLAALDMGLLLSAPDWPGPGPLLSALALPLFAALLAAAGWRVAAAFVGLLAGRARPSSRLLVARLLTAGLLSLPLIILVSFRLFQGTGISQRWYAPFGPLVVAPVLVGLTLGCVAVAARLLPVARRSGPGRALAGVLLLLAAALAALADRTLYPTQYAYLHTALLLVGSLALLGAAWLWLPVRGGGSGRWLAAVLLYAALPGLVVAAGWGLRSQRDMQVFAERTHLSGRLAALLRELLDLDGDHYSIIFGERDCHNRDPAIHPFAVEVPGNGVDEDCDGQDALLPPPRLAAAATGLADYQRLLERARREPAARELLRRTAAYNVILVVVDALRADQAVPSAENQRNHPRLLRLLAESRSFVRAFSAGAGTDIGMATIFTGQLDPFRRRHRSLFQAYRQAGFQTHGIFQREVERWVGRQFAIEGLSARRIVINDPGRRDVGTQPTSRQVTDEALRVLHRLVEKEGRFLMWIHYFDTHEHHQIDPARLPEPYRDRGPGRRAAYRNLLRFVDEQLGRLLDGLEQSGLGGRTIVALCGDHGEALGESPRLPANHGDVLFNPLVHVPMALRVPGLAAGEVRLAVSLADLFPTLLELSGIEPGSPGYGISLLPYLLSSAPAALRGFVRPVVMYETRQRSLLLWPWKFIAWQDSGRVELYHLERDFAEERNLADQEPQRARDMAGQLAGYPLVVVDRLSLRR